MSRKCISSSTLTFGHNFWAEADIDTKNYKNLQIKLDIKFIPDEKETKAELKTLEFKVNREIGFIPMLKHQNGYYFFQPSELVWNIQDFEEELKFEAAYPGMDGKFEVKYTLTGEQKVPLIKDDRFGAGVGVGIFIVILGLVASSLVGKRN
jgi:hypothetical protein